MRRWATGAFAGAGAVVVILWLAGRGRLPSVEAGIRARSFVWPTIETVVGLVVIASLVVVAGRAKANLATGSVPSAGAVARGAGVALLACETAFLIASGAPLVSSSATFLRPTPAETALRQAVGPALVAFGSSDCHTPPTLGIHQDINVVYGVHELADWDPMTPEAVFRSFKAATGAPAGSTNAPLILCPAIDSAAVAQRYGVGFILEHASSPRPPGTVFVSKVGNEKLYRVPRTASATLTPLGANGALPSPQAPGVPLRVTHPDAAAWNIAVSSSTPAVLRLHVTDVPGWQASIDGRSLHLEPLSGAMFQALVPRGRHTVELRYWPSTFTAGVALALASLVGLGAALVVGSRRQRRHHSQSV